MSEETPSTILFRILKETGTTQAALAKQLGVTRAAVNFWVTGREPIPKFRAEEVIFYLDLDPNEAGALLAEATGEGRVRVSSEEPTTFLDWLLRFDAVSSHLGATYGERVVKVADLTGVPVGSVLRWVSGDHLIPEAAVAVLCERAWGSIPPTAFSRAREVGRTVSEAVAVQTAVERAIYENEGPLTFSSVEDALFAAHDRWQKDPSVPLVGGFPYDERIESLPDLFIEAIDRFALAKEES